MLYVRAQSAREHICRKKQQRRQVPITAAHVVALASREAAGIRGANAMQALRRLAGRDFTVRLTANTGGGWENSVGCVQRFDARPTRTTYERFEREHGVQCELSSAHANGSSSRALQQPSASPLMFCLRSLEAASHDVPTTSLAAVAPRSGLSQLHPQRARRLLAAARNERACDMPGAGQGCRAFDALSGVCAVWRVERGAGDEISSVHCFCCICHVPARKSSSLLSLTRPHHELSIRSSSPTVQLPALHHIASQKRWMGNGNTMAL